MEVIDDGLMLKRDGNQARDDSIRFVEEATAMLPVQDAMRLLKSLGESLQPGYAAARAEGGDWSAIVAADRRAVPRAPATPERLLTAAPVAQLASYGPGGVYCVHSDNSRAEDGSRRNERALTSIVYCTPSDWSDEDEGWLRIWTDTDEVDCNVNGPTELGERLRDEGAPHVDILPLPGRIVFFRSTLLHEVLPSKARPRRAITQWFFSPCQEAE